MESTSGDCRRAWAGNDVMMISIAAIHIHPQRPSIYVSELFRNNFFYIGKLVDVGGGIAQGWKLFSTLSEM